MTDPLINFSNLQSRRSFLLNTGMGLGASALASLVSNRAFAAQPNVQAKAKRIIFLFMAGAPSQVDLFDYKPDLHKLFKIKDTEADALAVL